MNHCHVLNSETAGPRIKLTFLIALCLLLASASTAFAFQPLITDDTGTQGAGGNQFEFSVNEDRAHSDGNTTRTTTLPVVYTRGITDALDIFISANHTRIRSTVPGSDASGSGNPSLGAKWRFYENEESKISFGIKPEIALPVSDTKETQGLGTGRTSYGLTLILTKDASFGAVHANLFAGHDRYSHPATHDDSVTRVSVAPVWSVAEGWNLALDIGTETKKAGGISTQSSFGEIGAIYSPSKDLDFALGFIRTNDDAQPNTGTTSVTLGVTWRFK